MCRSWNVVLILRLAVLGCFDTTAKKYTCLACCVNHDTLRVLSVTLDGCWPGTKEHQGSGSRYRAPSATGVCKGENPEAALGGGVDWPYMLSRTRTAMFSQAITTPPGLWLTRLIISPPPRRRSVNDDWLHGARHGSRDVYRVFAAVGQVTLETREPYKDQFAHIVRSRNMPHLPQWSRFKPGTGARLCQLGETHADGGKS